MSRWKSRVVMISFAGLLAGPAAAEPGSVNYAAMVKKVAAMPNDPAAMVLAAHHSLSILNVLWEDTGRYEGSNVGPNISDVTIEVETKDARGGTQTALMPVLRSSNFPDQTADVKLDRVWIPVGNQNKGRALTHITLGEFLFAPTKYLSLPDRGKIKGGSLLAPRDSHALVSAQSTFLPVPKDAQATFWPVIFNYQSTKEHPAVLTLLVTRQGTSATVVDNVRDALPGRSWGQRLLFNNGGQRAPLTAERLSTVKQKGVTANGEAASSLGGDSNLMMIVQVPLVIPPPPRRSMAPSAAFEGAPLPSPAPMVARRALDKSDVETAVLGHGPELGPYTELDGRTIERDVRFPVRVTVQFYQATSNGVVDDKVLADLAGQIRKVYKSADYVGSLVVPTPGDRARPTNWDGVGPMPLGTRCEDFPGLLERGVCKPGQTANTVLMPQKRKTAGIQ